MNPKDSHELPPSLHGITIHDNRQVNFLNIFRSDVVKVGRQYAGTQFRFI